MADWQSIADIRREYRASGLDENIVNPFEQFKIWFAEVLQSEISDPTAMVLATCDGSGNPDARVVLLKGIENEAFIFFTNYESTKARQIAHHPYVALNFYWPQMMRQVRIRGSISKIDSTQSDEYFSSRPLKSQASAIISPQSKTVASRAVLEDAFNALLAANASTPLMRPQHWGGYQVFPDTMEFWQGRESRLHDRLLYSKKENEWQHARLAP